MIWLRREGELIRNGLNIQLQPWLRLILRIGGRKWSMDWLAHSSGRKLHLWHSRREG